MIASVSLSPLSSSSITSSSPTVPPSLRVLKSLVVGWILLWSCFPASTVWISAQVNDDEGAASSFTEDEVSGTTIVTDTCTITVLKASDWFIDDEDDDDALPGDDSSSNRNKDTNFVSIPHSDMIRYVEPYDGFYDTHDLDEVILHYGPADGQDMVYEIECAPLYFWGLNEDQVEKELSHFLEHDGRWSNRVLLEKLYFGLLHSYSMSSTHNNTNTSTSPSSAPATSTSSSTTASTPSAQREFYRLEEEQGWDVMVRDDDVCDWKGVTCRQSPTSPHTKIITEIRLDSFGLSGTLTKDLYLLSDLEKIDLKDNDIVGTIPSTWGRFPKLKYLSLSVNELTGSIPETFSHLSKIEYLSLSSNSLTGSLPTDISKWTNIKILDVSNNQLEGTIPIEVATHFRKLLNLFLENNKFQGPLPESPHMELGLESLQVMDLGSNQLSGTIPTVWMSLPNLRDMNIAENRFVGTIPSEILKLTNLEVLVLSDNRLQGQIPRRLDDIPGRNTKTPTLGEWAGLSKVELLMLSNNQLTGRLPPELLSGLSKTLKIFEIGNNRLSGELPEEIGHMVYLDRFDGSGNRFTGSLPFSMNHLDPNLQLNLTNNLLVGTVPKIFCGGGPMTTNLLHRQFGCDAILCPAGTFHPHGAATLEAGCRLCPVDSNDDDNDPPPSRLLGRTRCDHVEFVHGDLNGDGLLSPREILRLLFVSTIGRNWGTQFQTWGDMSRNECDLYGVVCVNGAIAKLDLTDAALCTNGERKAGPASECLGLPSELFQLTDLEVLTLNRRHFLSGSIPTQIGKLTKLRYLDISSCQSMVGRIPSELGLLTQLKYLNLGGCRFNGTMPSELFELTNLEKLHLSMNPFTGTFPTAIGRLLKLKEIMFSRTLVTGNLPSEFGKLTALENLEMYGNRLNGTIPGTLGDCLALKRIDLFNNQLTGTIPDSLSTLQSLQILHVKLNNLTGTISHKFGELPYLSWFDVSANELYGTIPSTFGSSRSIKDFRLGGNMIYDPIPPSLCTNANINGGLTRMYGCDGVICPLGTYSDPGHATHSDGCKKCPEGETTMYLGSASCQKLSDADILSVFFDVMRGDKWSPHQKRNWKDESVNVCKWHGVNCNEQGEITSLRLPLVNSDEYPMN